MKFVIPLLAITLFLAGCAKNTSEEDAGPVSVTTSSAVKQTSASAESKKGTVGGVKVMNAPPTDPNQIPAEGIVIRPANPNDPVYKPDPSLGGGN